MLAFLFSVYIAHPAVAQLEPSQAKKQGTQTAFNSLDVVSTEILNRPALPKGSYPAGTSIDCSSPDQKLSLKKKEWIYNGEVIAPEKVFYLELQGVSTASYISDGQRHELRHYLLSLKLLLDEEKPFLLFCLRDSIR
jgi:hypothetical protein